MKLKGLIDTYLAAVKNGAPEDEIERAWEALGDDPVIDSKDASAVFNLLCRLLARAFTGRRLLRAWKAAITAFMT